jgi:uncharacterized protein YkwD
MTDDRPAMPYPSPDSRSHIGRFTCPLLLLFLLAACQTTHPTVSSGQLPSKHPKPAISGPDLEKRIHAVINRERTAHGLSPLARDEALSRIARGHSKDMAGRSFFSHDSPEGRDFLFRYRQQGYTCALRIGDTIHTGAENIALNNLYRSITTINGVAYHDWNTAEQIALSTVRGWMNSPGHRKNILTPHWLNQGIGVFISADGKVYITQNFC